jgi:hypothetical protein
VTTALVLGVLLGWLGAVRSTARGLALAALVCGFAAVAAFGLPRLVVGPVAAAVIGLVLYSATLAVWRPPGLRHAWAYVRSLE